MPTDVALILCFLVVVALIAITTEIILPIVYGWLEERDKKWQPRIAKNCPYCNSPRIITAWKHASNERTVSYNCPDCDGGKVGFVVQTK